MPDLRHWYASMPVIMSSNAATNRNVVRMVCAAWYLSTCLCGEAMISGPEAAEIIKMINAAARVAVNTSKPMMIVVLDLFLITDTTLESNGSFLLCIIKH